MIKPARIDPRQTHQIHPELRIDPVIELVLNRLRLRARRRIAWLRKLWSEAGISEKQQFDIHTEVDGYLSNQDIPELETTWFASEECMRQLNGELAEIEQAIANDKHSRFALLHQIFGLSREESDLLQACLAIALEPNFGRVFAYTQEHAGRLYVTEELVARLFGNGRCLLLSAESPLRIWDLVSEVEMGGGEPKHFKCDLDIRNWLQGMDDLDNRLVGISSLHLPQEPLINWPVNNAVRFITNRIQGDSPQRIRMQIKGVPGSGRRTLAACISAGLNMPLLVVDVDRIENQDWQSVFIHAQRHAYLQRCALAWCGETLAQRSWPRIVPDFHVQFVIGEGNSVAPVAGLVEYTIAIPLLSTEERRNLWQQLVPVSSTWPGKDFEALVKRHQVNIGQIATIAEKGPETVEEANAMLREASRHRLGNLAQLFECPFDWDDLIIPDWMRRNLEDFIFEAQDRSEFWEYREARRLFPQGRGLIGLFTGSPGTGKTMASQVIAANLGLDLFRIDLSSVVSKYVGETSKNLERILSRGAQMNAVLLFDEADALFGKRTDIKDAHDRFANTDTNYLLQAIEGYPGVAILASNKKENIDSGFTRRLRYVLDFPKPDARQRMMIWRRLIGELAGEDRLKTLTVELSRLSEGVELTGAQIKFAVLSAMFIARREKAVLVMPHLLRGLERELMKEGRGISRRVQDIMMGREE